MRHILVSLALGEQTIDLAIPPHLTSSDVLAWLAATGRWEEQATDPRLERSDGEVLDPDRSIEECGVLDGAILRVRSPDAAPLEVVDTASRHTVSPVSIPEPLSLAERARIVLRVFGARDGGWRRALEAWRWTDHERRLAWLIGRPSLTAGAIIRVTGHRSRELAGWLASAIGSVRPGSTLVVEPGSDEQEGAATLDRLILIGVSSASDRTVHADPHRQTVVSTIGPLRSADPGVVVAWWADGHPDPPIEGAAWRRISEDPIASLELAAVLAGGWR